MKILSFDRFVKNENKCSVYILHLKTLNSVECLEMSTPSVFLTQIFF